MPLYDFKCTDPACGKVMERLVSATRFQVECTCGGLMEKQISGSQSFYFKGVGAHCEKSMNKTSVNNR